MLAFNPAQANELADAELPKGHPTIDKNHSLSTSSLKDASNIPTFKVGNTEGKTSGNYITKAEPFFQSYCISCHGTEGEKIRGDLDLREFASDESIIKDRDIWFTILEQIETEEMPTKKPFPSDTERADFVEWLHAKLNEIDWSKVKHAGHVTMPRLTKQEYVNTIRDLLGMDVRPGYILFDDGEGNSGFTTDRSSLFITPSSMEKYISAAQKALAPIENGVRSTTKVYEAENMLSTSVNVNAKKSPLMETTH